MQSPHSSENTQDVLLHLSTFMTTLGNKIYYFTISLIKSKY